MNKNYKNQNYLTSNEFLKVYEERLKKRGVNKPVAKKVMSFLLKNIVFNVLVGNVVRIDDFGSFKLKEFGGRRYNIGIKNTEEYKEDRFIFTVARKLKLSIREGKKQK